ncbi:MAG: 3D domain-containing protein [Phycisphaerae bacterium]|nr:3D domain-containing protein [Phycisphaerae bacterium]
MASRYQPLARLVCLALLALSLVSGSAVEPPSAASGHQATASVVPPANVDREAVHPTDSEYSGAAIPSSPARNDPPPSAPDNPASKTLYRICRVTAYCDRGITASGVHSGVGQCAAPGYIPLGSTVYVPALNRTFVVTDRTHRRFRQSTVDIFIPSKRQCRQFGRQYLECEFTVPAEDR